MVSFDFRNLPKCTIDFPLEITPDEIGSLSHPINTLLRSSYLIGGSFNLEESVHSLFDIAGEIAGVESCGFLLPLEASDGTWELKVSRRFSPPSAPNRLPDLHAPAVMAAHFGKGISFDSDSGDWASSICDAWASRSLVAFPLRRERDIAGALVFGKRDSHPFTNVQIKLLCTLSMQAEIHLHRYDSVLALSYYSLIDPLTHLYNRQYFDDQLEKEILRSRRSGNTFSLMLFDLDGFTDYNDRFLNSSGDITLQEFADIMRGSMREVDTLARIGGDEFGVILLESDAEGAQALATRIIERFQRHLLPGSRDSRTERLSVSVGIAAFPSDSFDHADLVAKATAALDLARSQGGGKACTFHETAGPSVKNRTSSADLPIRKIFDAGRSVVDMDSFLEILLFTGMQGISACRGSIVVKTPDGKDFSLRAAIGFNRIEDHLSVGGTFAPGAVTSWVVDHQLPLVVSRTEDSPISVFLRKDGYQSDSFLSIPLTHAGKTLGALNLTHKKDDQYFTRDDLQALSPIASEIASILSQGITFRENVRRFSLSILGSLTDALELRYSFLSGHSARVRNLAVRTGERMGLSKDDLDILDNAAFLHDVGIVGVPSNILSKKRTLNDREVDQVRKHPFLGAKLVEGIPGMDSTKRTILEHHEHFDGSGYPHGLRGADICLTARILGVAEYYDSIVSERPYRG
ncbi:MAG: diguanylate cyclase, partial [Deltaproteobacteria bacterium]|nr:diguanylate cyclase [Deltaproteobacteria bacterium]